jgi:type II secretory pathway component PulF
VAIPVVRHALLREQLEQLPDLIRQGGSLAESLKQMPLMTSFVVNTIAIGEESGKAGEAFLEVAAVYERESERLLQTAASLLEPAMVLGVGAMVGWIVFAVLLPIFELSGLPT